MSHTEDDRLVIAKNFPTRALAEAGQRFLEQHKIVSILQSSDVAGTGNVQGCDLYVQQQNLRQAHELLEGLYDGI
jgi:hypothetical protein